ncbi:P-loop NTPase fold protein [Mesorhizobium sp. M0296]|uniref:KAP family P-loop NTPase fold protein n=1 Tax=Mesorhizobium sp. M0296 TaxID=2956931 RepID=UPI003336FD9C
MINEEELEAIWADDLLGRKQDASFLQQFLVARVTERQAAGKTGSYVIDIDAQWGAGKSFFVDRFATQLKKSGHLVATVNAWRDDHMDDPFVAILASIDAALAPFTKKKSDKASVTWSAVKKSATPIIGRVVAGAAKTLVKRYTGESVDALLEHVTGADETREGIVKAEKAGSLIDDVVSSAAEVASIEIERIIDQSAEQLIEIFQRKNEAILDFRIKLETALVALSEVKLPLFVLIDELDRCRPSYAIALLERVKHLFDVDNVVFVFANNSEQLKHTISGAYGEYFDGFRYLKRFFDRTYVFERPSLDEFIKTLLADVDVKKLRSPIQSPSDFLVIASDRYGMELREVQHVLDIVRTVTTIWSSTIPIDLVLLFPLATTFYRTGNVEWDSVKMPDNSTIALGMRYARGLSPRYERELAPREFSISEAFKLSTEIFDSMQKMMDFGNSDSISPTADYVRMTFTPEWNGVRVMRDAPSIQRQLAGFVRSAGRLAQVEFGLKEAS